METAITALSDVEIGNNSNQPTRKISNTSNLKNSVISLQRNQKVIIGVLIIILIIMDMCLKIFNKDEVNDDVKKYGIITQ